MRPCPGTESLLCLSQTLCTKATMQTVRAADTNEVVKLIFRESDNDRKVSKPCTVGCDRSRPPCVSGAGEGAVLQARSCPTRADGHFRFAGRAPAGEETLRLLQPGGFPGQQRHCGELRRVPPGAWTPLGHAPAAGTVPPPNPTPVSR